MADPLKQILEAVQVSIAQINKRLHQIDTHELATSTGAIQYSTYAGLPATGLGPGVSNFCTDCRKVGEGAGAGTGVLVYYNKSTTNWRRITDDAVAAI